MKALTIFGVIKLELLYYIAASINQDLNAICISFTNIFGTNLIDNTFYSTKVTFKNTIQTTNESDIYSRIKSYDLKQCKFHHQIILNE